MLELIDKTDEFGNWSTELNNDGNKHLKEYFNL